MIQMSNNLAAEWLSVEQAATELGIGAPRVRQLLQAGTLKGQKLSERVWAIHRSDLAKFKKIDRPVGNPTFGTAKRRRRASSK